MLRAAAAKVTRHLPSLAERDVATRDYSVVCGVLRGSLREHPYRRSPKLHFANFQINYPLDLLQELGCEKYKCIFTFFTTRYRYLTNTKLMHIRYDVRIRAYIYIYTDRHCVRSPLWGSLWLAPTTDMCKPLDVVCKFSSTGQNKGMIYPRTQPFIPDFVTQLWITKS